KAATDNANELASVLQREANSVRQAQITQEIIAMSKSASAMIAHS
ncbi:F0F1 ATP synthase subunit gamma, partial [Nocardia beijingensis]